MPIIDAITERLARYPQARYEVRGAEVCVFPTTEDGFTVRLVDRGGSFSVFFEGWHEEFTDEAQALECFAFGLSQECRLKEWVREGRACKWTVESKTGDAWVEDSTVGLLLFPFWRRATVRYRRNHLVGQATEERAR